MTTLKIGSAWNAQISQRKYLMVLLHAIKNREDVYVSMLIIIYERYRANDTHLKYMKRDISDIKKELPKMCNDIGESSTEIKTHTEKQY